MNDSKISVRYAKALFKLAKSENILDKFFDDSVLVYQILDDKQIFDFLRNPIVKNSQKIAFLEALKKYISNEFFQFLQLIVVNNRENYLKLIILNFKKYFFEEKGIFEVEVTTTTELTENVVNELKKLLSSKLEKQIILQNNIKPEIIGGFIAKVDDLQIDASIRTQLNNFRKELKYN